MPGASTLAEDSPFVWERQDFQQRRTIDLLCREFEDAWHSADRLSIESFSEKIAANSWTALLSELIACEWELRERSGDRPSPAEYLQRFPDQQDFIRQLVSDSASGGSSSHSGSQPRSTTRELQLGDEFAGFQIIGKLGSGGMGTVYRATIPVIDHVVALKILDCRPRHFESVAVRFEQEARLLSRLNAPGIVPLHSYGETNGLRYLVMKFISGVSLAEVLAVDDDVSLDSDAKQRDQLAALVHQIRTLDAPGRSDLLLDLATQLATALDVVHAAGVLHRDIKPSNILLTPEGKVILTDFGLARDERSGANLTQGGEFLGTPRYAAPETLDGDFTRQSDLYSLGLVLFELFSLKTPFKSRGLRDLLKAKLSGSIPEMGNAPWASPDEERVIRGLLHSSVEKRTASASSLARQLAACRTSSSRWFLRPGIWKRSAVVVITLLMVVAGWTLVVLGPPRSSEQSPPSSVQPQLAKSNGEVPSSPYAEFEGLTLRQQFQLPPATHPEHLAISQDASTVLVATRDQQLFRGDAILDQLTSTSAANARKIEVVGLSGDGKYAFLVQKDAGRTEQPQSEFFVESWSIRDLCWKLVPGPQFVSNGATPVFIRGFPDVLPALVLIPHRKGPTVWVPDTGGYVEMPFLGDDRTASAMYSMTSASATERGTIEIFRREAKPGEQPETTSTITDIHDVFELQFSPDGRFLVAIGQEQLAIITMRDLRITKLPNSIPNATAATLNLSFSANGRFLTLWTRNELRLFDLETCQLAGSESSVDEHIHVGSMSTGRHMIIAFGSGRICLSDWSTGSLDVPMEARGPRILAADYSDATRQLAVGTVHGSIDCLEIKDVTVAP